MAVRLALFYAAAFLFIGVSLPFWPVWLSARGLSATEIGLLITAGTWVRIAAPPLAAHFADRSGRRRPVLVVLAAAAFAVHLLFLAAEGFAALLAVSILAAVAFTPILPMGENMTLLAARDRGLDYGRVRLWGSFAFIVGAIVGGRLVGEAGSAAILWLVLGTLALTDLFPEAEVHAIDIGGAMLRYAHARAESLGKPVHFHQQDARHLKFEDESFDMVTSEILFHETSRTAMPAILKEARRVLKPGGAMCNLEVPLRYKGMDMGAVVVRDWQNYYNAEPFWGSLGCVDIEQAMREAGFARVLTGFQPRTGNFQGERGRLSEKDPSMGNLSHWMVFGGYKDQER